MNGPLLKVFSGRAHPSLTEEICRRLGFEPGHVTLYSFSDGESYVQIDENVRGADVFVVQPTCPPVNDHLMELLIIIDALRRSSARRITAVIPYFGYARQDRKPGPRTPISAKLVANLITRAGADRVMTLDLHAGQIQGFFDIPTDNLYASPVMVRDIRERGLDLESKAAVYVPFTQTTIGFFIPSQIAVLTSRSPLEISKELQQAVWAVDPEQPVVAIATMDSIVDTEFAGRSQVLRLLGAFAALAVLLAAFGTYSVISYLVSLRTREIGLRIAVGARRRDIVTSMVWYSARLVAVGIVMGLLFSVLATQLLSSLLFGISPLDPITFAAVSAGLAVVALIASALPVLRASRIDPMLALRSE